MKLRNKKTGEIADLEHKGLVRSNPKGKLVVWKTNANDFEEYNSLAELNEEWEDYEKPKDDSLWWIDFDGEVVKDKATEYDTDDEGMKAIGNYFDTKEEAEKAVEKLKAWKRLKDKGFRFCPVDRYEALGGNGFDIPITATMPPEAYTDVGVSKDLDILFGGED